MVSRRRFRPCGRRPGIDLLGFSGFFAVLALAITVAAGNAASAQTVSDGATPPGSGISPPLRPGDHVDVNRIDPEAFKAIAGKLPDGKHPTIDGNLDEEIWMLAPPITDFIQREPDFGALSTERTEVRILYDDRTLYFGVWNFDSDAAHIVASELKRDSNLGKGDQIKIVIDGFHDHRNALAFNTNPLGAFKDLNSVDDGRIINYDWNAVWRCKTSRDGHGWYAEIAIPLSQLRFKRGIGETIWGLNICRTIIRKHEETYWVPYPREWGPQGITRMSHAGVLSGLRDLNIPRRLEFLPYTAPRVSRDYVAGSPTDVDNKYGFDLRLGVTSELTADLTYKTDFAQVEADQEIVNLTRFSLFFPEKRQFFTESAGIFDYGRSGGATTFLGGDAGQETTPGLLSLFYSRRIGLQDGQEVPIVAGGKLTGRVGPYTVGFINMETDSAQIGGAAIPRANYSVFRVKRNILSKSSIGGIILNSEGGASDYNRSAGFDAALSFGSHTNITGLLARTFSPGSSGQDWAGAVDYAWQSDRFNYDATYLDVGERFNAEMGFVPRIDIRNSRLTAGWTPRPGWPGVRQLTLGGKIDYYEKHTGQTVSRTQDVNFAIEQQNGAFFNVNLDRDYDFLSEPFPIGPTVVPVGGYSWDTLRASYSMDTSKRLYGSASVALGSYYNGDKQTYGLHLNFLPLRALLIEPNYTRNRFTAPGVPAYVTNVVSTRVSYALSPELFLKAFAQYNDDRRLATFNFLFWYIYRPGSDLYVVYDSGWETEPYHLSLAQVRNRSLSVKVTYWLGR